MQHGRLTAHGTRVLRHLATSALLLYRGRRFPVDDRLRMLIRDFVQLAKPYSDVAVLLANGADTLLHASAHSAYREGEEMSIRLGPSGKHPHIGKRVMLDVGRPYEKKDSLVIPICWWATKAPWLFPCLDGDLMISPVGEDHTQITLLARYEAPLAAIGRGMDHLVLHRVVDASVRSFLLRIGDALNGILMDGPQQAAPLGA